MVLTSFGTGDSEPLLGWFLKTVFIHGALKSVYFDHGIQERVVRESGLEFVFARPTRLTNGSAKGKVVRTAELVALRFNSKSNLPTEQIHFQCLKYCESEECNEAIGPGVCYQVKATPAPAPLKGS